MWFYFQQVLIPHQRDVAGATGTPRGNLSDLYPRWLGSRELLLHDRNPYSPEITREIQIGYYGRALDPNRPNDPKDQQAFAYPAYVVLLLAATVRFPFSTVNAGFRWFLLALTGASVLLWLRFLRWRVSVATSLITLILTLGGFGALQGIKLQQFSLLVSALIAGCAASLIAGHLFFAGILLAIATIKPQLTAVLAFWLTIWSLTDWKQRQSFLWGFGSTLLVLVGGAELLLPGWIRDFRSALSAYRQYTGPSLLDTVVTPSWSRLATGVAVAALAVVCWKLGRDRAESDSFAFVFALVLAVTVALIPMFAPYNQLLLLPGVLLVAQHWHEFRATWRRRLVFALATAAIGWPWLASVAVMLLYTLMPQTMLPQAWALPLYTVVAIPLAVLAALVLLIVDHWRARVAGTRLATQPSLALRETTR